MIVHIDKTQQEKHKFTNHFYDIILNEVYYNSENHRVQYGLGESLPMRVFQ